VWQKFDDHCHRCQCPPREGRCHERTNKHDRSTGEPHESTYALLIRSEEKSRNLFEVAIYPLLSLGPLIAIWQFAQQPVNIPLARFKGAGCVVCVDEFHTVPEVRHPEIKG